MGFFSKKKKEDNYQEASRALNSSPTSPADKIVIEQMEDDDEKAASYVNLIKSGIPVILNFEKLDEKASNKMLAFMAGAAFALDGKSVRINNTTYLFARKSEFIDGSLMKFINDIPTQ